MNYPTTISNIESTPEQPLEEILHSETNTDETLVEDEMNDDELRALVDENPFFHLDAEQEEEAPELLQDLKG